MEIYDRIKALCDGRGIAVTTLETALGFGRGSIGKLKQGRTTSPERLQKIADFFGVPLSFFFDGEDEGLRLTGEAARIAQDVVLRDDVRVLLCEALKATQDDVAATTAMLRRLNAYARMIGEQEGRGTDAES